MRRSSFDEVCKEIKEGGPRPFCVYTPEGPMLLWEYTCCAAFRCEWLVCADDTGQSAKCGCPADVPRPKSQRWEDYCEEDKDE